MDPETAAELIKRALRPQSGRATPPGAQIQKPKPKPAEVKKRAAKQKGGAEDDRGPAELEQPRKRARIAAEGPGKGQKDEGLEEGGVDAAEGGLGDVADGKAKNIAWSKIAAKGSFTARVQGGQNLLQAQVRLFP